MKSLDNSDKLFLLNTLCLFSTGTPPVVFENQAVKMSLISCNHLYMYFVQVTNYWEVTSQHAYSSRENGNTTTQLHLVYPFLLKTVKLELLVSKTIGL